MSNSRIAMHQASNDTLPYVKFDGYVNYKPTKGIFSVYLTESKESKEFKEIWGALITQRNVALASSLWDKPVTSQDFDSFSEKLFFKETVKWGKVLSKWLTYSETQARADDIFQTNSYKLGSAFYLVTEKGAVLKMILTWTTRSKVNALIEEFKTIDFLTFSAKEESVTVGSGSRSKEVYELNVVESTKEYNREAIDKISWTVNTLNKILEFKKTWKTTVSEEDTSSTVADAEKVFANNDTEDTLPI